MHVSRSPCSHSPQSDSPCVGGVLLSCLVFIGAFSALPCFADVSGTVLELGTGTPLSGALVTLQPTIVGITQTQVVTDANGDFVLPTPNMINLIVVGANKGHFHSAVTVNDGAAGVLIELDPVVVTYDPTYEFDPGFCGFCHGPQFGQWSDSRMGKTGSNEWVYDLFNGTGTAGGMGGVRLHPGRRQRRHGSGWPVRGVSPAGALDSQRDERAVVSRHHQRRGGSPGGELRHLSQGC